MAKCLLISADEMLAPALQARLAKAGLEVDHRSTGHGGLARARQWTPDLIVLDLLLPGLHGLQVLRRMRDVPWLVKIPVVMLIERTCLASTVQECLCWGAASCLEKDRYSLSELITHVFKSLACQ